MEITINDKKITIKNGEEKDYIDLHNAISGHCTGRIVYEDSFYKDIYNRRPE